MLSVFIFFYSITFANSAKEIRVSCVGDSITWGMTVENREVNCYPNQLGVILGAGYKVQNFGSNGATCMRQTPENNPYIKRDVYQRALNSNPDIVVIMLGANDSKPIFWDQQSYVQDYKFLIDEFKSLTKKPKIYLCLPVNSFTKIMGPWDVNAGNLSVVRMLINDLAKETKCEIIDMFSPLNKRDFFSTDGVHPNAKGAREIAQVIYGH